jgi:hypothetical protein
MTTVTGPRTEAELLGAMDPEARRQLIGSIAATAVAFEVHRWRDAVRGNEEGEEELVAVLRRARIGPDNADAGVSAELDRRTALLPSPPSHPPITERLLASWAQHPESVESAERWATAQSAAGPNPAALYPGVLRRESEEGSSIAEAALIVLADAVALARAESAVPAEDASARLGAVEERFGRLSEGGTDPDSSASRRADVLSLLLREIPLRARRPRIPVRATLAESQPEPAQAAPGHRWRRLAVALGISLAIAALTGALPRHQPGQLQPAQLVGHAGPPCATCAPDQRLVGVGFQRYQGEPAITVRLGAPPRTTSLLIRLADPSGSLAVQRHADGWSTAGSGVAFDTRHVLVTSTGSIVVITLPADARVGGVAVASSAGDQIPASGTIRPTTEAGATFNLLDVLIILLVLAACVRGLRAGFIRTAPMLAGFALSLVAARLLYPPLGSALLGHLTNAPRVADSMAVAFITTVVGLGLYALAGTSARRVVQRLAPKVGLTPESPADARLGAIARALRSTASAATMLTLFVNLVSASWFASLAANSILGRGLIEAWRHLYPGL